MNGKSLHVDKQTFIEKISPYCMHKPWVKYKNYIYVRLKDYRCYTDSHSMGVIMNQLDLNANIFEFYSIVSSVIRILVFANSTFCRKITC